ncbi:MAG TPA: hypothetical protein VMR70_09125, partial [Flavisolibacter sp.]|nr:hypothetical protein [Flavisolibacter sp.]
MKYVRLCFLLLVTVITGKLSAQLRTVIELKDYWKFSREKADGAFQTSFNDQSWQTVSVPHDWAIYGPFDKEIDKQVVAISQNNEKVASEKTGRTGSLPYIGEGWYRKRFRLPLKKGQKALILFEGAMSEPRVYLNGKKAGEWNYGYNYFYFDITDKLSAGDNVLAVHLRNVGESSRWYPGAGLYRKVSIIVKNAESIDQWGTYITTPFISSEQAKVNIKTTVSGKNLRLVTDILDADGKKVATGTTQTLFGEQFDQNVSIP